MRVPQSATVLGSLILLICGVAGAQLSAPGSPEGVEASGVLKSLSVSFTNENLQVGSTATAPAGELPTAPSPVSEKHVAGQQPPYFRMPVGNTFWVANGLLLGSTIADAEMITRCRASSCQSIPDSIRTRGALYGIGIPASLAVTYISYKLKRAGTKWWLVPVALFTAGNVVYAAHAAEWSR